jgi:alpha-tubulin suppressor-like RCC1 family protein
VPAVVAAGWKHAAVVDLNMQAYVWGDGADGQLGVDARLKSSARPHLVSRLMRVRVCAE